MKNFAHYPLLNHDAYQPLLNKADSKKKLKKIVIKQNGINKHTRLINYKNKFANRNRYKFLSLSSFLVLKINEGKTYIIVFFIHFAFSNPV